MFWRSLQTNDVKLSYLRFWRQRQLDQKACRTCSTIIFLHSTNQIFDLWRCRWRCRRQILNSLIYRAPTRSYECTCTVICSQCSMRAKSDNRKIVTIAQMFTCKWCFTSRNRRGYLNFVISPLYGGDFCVQTRTYTLFYKNIEAEIFDILRIF